MGGFWRAAPPTQCATIPPSRPPIWAMRWSDRDARPGSAAMLKLDHLAAGYGPAQVLFDVSLAVGAGEVVTLLGRNGMGKTTTIRVLMGLLPARSGAVHFDGRPLIGLPPYRIAQAGLGLVPEGRQIFPALTVEENLVATAAARFSSTV